MPRQSLDISTETEIPGNFVTSDYALLPINILYLPRCALVVIPVC